MTPQQRNSDPQMFIQIHYLAEHALGHPNGAERQGAIKTTYYGGHPRSYISSQKCKFVWFRAANFDSGQAPAEIIPTIRSKRIIEDLIIGPIAAEEIASNEVIEAVEDALLLIIHGRNATDERGRQMLPLSEPEVTTLQSIVKSTCEKYPTNQREAVSDIRKQLGGRQSGYGYKGILDTNKTPGGLMSVMFGRMVTSDPAASVDAPIYVAHNIAVHSNPVTRDHFAAIDHLVEQDDERTGAAYLGSVDLTSGIYYGYVAINVPLLVSHLEGVTTDRWLSADRQLASYIVRHTLKAICEQSVTSKLGSTADLGGPSLIAVEVGDNPLRNMVHAFAKPVDPPQLAPAIEALNTRMRQTDVMRGASTTRKVAALEDPNMPAAEWVNIPQLCEWTAHTVREAAWNTSG